MGTNDTKETKPTGSAAPAAPAAAAAAPTEESSSKEKKTSFDVLNSGGVVARTYTVEEHGSKAGELAKEYAGKINGSVK